MLVGVQIFARAHLYESCLTSSSIIVVNLCARASTRAHIDEVTLSDFVNVQVCKQSLHA